MGISLGVLANRIDKTSPDIAPSRGECREIKNFMAARQGKSTSSPRKSHATQDAWLLNRHPAGCSGQKVVLRLYLSTLGRSISKGLTKSLQGFEDSPICPIPAFAPA